MAWENTGKSRFRQTRWRRTIIIQVEQQDSFYRHWFRWKDATLNDLQDAVFGSVENRTIEVPNIRLVTRRSST